MNPILQCRWRWGLVALLLAAVEPAWGAAPVPIRMDASFSTGISSDRNHASTMVSAKALIESVDVLGMAVKSGYRRLAESLSSRWRRIRSARALEGGSFPDWMAALGILTGLIALVVYAKRKKTPRHRLRNPAAG